MLFIAESSDKILETQVWRTKVSSKPIVGSGVGRTW